jgi:ketol-acid reductoisomerase
MPLKIIRNAGPASISPLHGKVVAVLGYGNQGHAHALNLRDSGIRIVIGARGGESAARAARAGFDALAIADASARADLVILALPDEVQPEVFAAEIAPVLKPGATIGFIHGFNIRYSLITPAAGVGVVMVAPKGPGRTLRDRFVQGQGLPCLLAVHQESQGADAEQLALAWAAGIGGARAGIICTTFKDETDTDLFGEQAVLCGGVTWLILAAFETLVSAGYPPELAYLECCHEVKQIADLVYTQGIAAMMERISNTAEFGAYAQGPKLIDEPVRRHMKQILADIQDGTFARNLQADHKQGFDWFMKQRAKLKSHEIEKAGRDVRSLMPWLEPAKDPFP